ncbi:hypothetical protein SCANM124S_02881 [Streptomyces canus]
MIDGLFQPRASKTSLRKGPADSGPGDQEPAEGRSKGPCRVQVHGAESRRPRDLVPRYEAGLQCLPGRGRQCESAAHGERQGQQRGWREVAGPRECREQERRRGHHDLDRDEQHAPVHEVGERAGGQREQQHREAVGDLHPGHVRGSAVHEEPLRADGLHPTADVRAELCQPQDAEHAISQRCPRPRRPPRGGTWCCGPIHFRALLPKPVFQVTGVPTRLAPGSTPVRAAVGGRVPLGWGPGANAAHAVVS